MALKQTFFVALFGLGMVLALVSTWLLSAVLMLVPASILSVRTRQGWIFVILGTSFRVMLFFLPWINVAAAPDAAENWGAFVQDLRAMDRLRAEKPELAHPLFMWGNHTSYMDPVICGAFTPAALLNRIKIYAGAHLLKIPIFGTLCKWMGHFEVHFKGTSYNDFTIDKEKMAAVQKRIDEHIAAGGVMSSFPEGRVNATPEQLSPFRTGGMRQALQLDGRIWSFVAVNNEACWPFKAQIGGLPCNIRYSVKPLARDGCKALVRELRARNDADDKDLEDHQLLGKYAQQFMQKQYNVLKASLNITDNKKD